MLPQRKPNRLKGYDYSRDNLYFITSCVKDMICCFGNVVQGEMELNDYGKIAHDQFLWLAQQYPYIQIPIFVVMPNHFHAIIEIKAARELPMQYPKIKSLSELLGAYKSTVSKQIHLSGYEDFAWHRSFHDHIIRDHDSYIRIYNYIQTNPLRWDQDKFNEGNP
jgi:REP element-mobilizing transposase RayT